MHKGIAVSPGVVVGVAFRVDSVFGTGEPQALASPGLVPAEIERFERAIATSAAELEAIVTKVAQQLGAAEAEIFKTHLQIVNDRTLHERVRSMIGAKGLTALSSLQIVLQGYAASFARIEQDYLRERLADLRDVFSRIGSHLTVHAAPASPSLGHDPKEGEEPVILVAMEILPSQAMSLGNLPIAGIVTEAGGGTSHAAILARSPGHPGRLGGVVRSHRRRPLRRRTIIVRRPARGSSSSGRPTTRCRRTGSFQRVLRPQGPARPQPRQAGRLRRRGPDRIARQRQQRRRRPGRREGRRYGGRPLPDRVPAS